MLFWNQHGSDNKFVPLILPEQQPTRLTIHRSVHLCDGEEAREAFAWDVNGFEIGDGIIAGVGRKSYAVRI